MKYVSKAFCSALQSYTVIEENGCYKLLHFTGSKGRTVATYPFLTKAEAKILARLQEKKHRAHRACCDELLKRQG